MRLTDTRIGRDIIGIALLMTMISGSSQAEDSLEHGIANSGGVKIHYVTAGEGPLVVMIHGFPDFWYTWRDQIPVLSQKFKVVAIDQRGYNQSDQPDGVDSYRMSELVSDVEAVIRHFARDQAIVVGHDWGGMVAWSFAMMRPEMTEKLVILNLPHPNGFRRELANNPKQQSASEYARVFQQPDAAKSLSAELLAEMVAGSNKSVKSRYVEAMSRSSFEGMLNYYKANYPREPYEQRTSALPKVKCPVLMIHGLKDEALLASGLNDTWEWVQQDLTLVTLPNAGHWVHHDASQKVTRIISRWLEAGE